VRTLDGVVDWANRLESRIERAFVDMDEQVSEVSNTTEVISSTTNTATGLARYHDTTYNPVILLQGNEAPGAAALDRSGNGFDVALTTGAGRRIVLFPGQNDTGNNVPLQGYWFEGSADGTSGTYYTMAGGAGGAANTALRITGDMTIEWIGFWNFDLGYTASRAVCSFGLPGTDADNNNCLYRPAVFQDDHSLSTFHEHSVGDDVFDDTLLAASPIPTHYCVIRSNDGARYDWLIDGQLVHTVTGLTPPEGSSAGTFKFGASHTNGGRMSGAICSLKLIARALALDEGRAEYNRTLGPVKGLVALEGN
jgi:hypothetical protein